MPPQLPPNSAQQLPSPKQRSKPKRIPKSELIQALLRGMTPFQWELIAQLRGIPTPATDKKKESFLNGSFKKKISTSSAKGKGRNLQQWLARKISEFTGLPWGKDESIASREGAQAGTDVRLLPEARKLFNFSVECKSGNTWALPAAIKQCKSNLYPNSDWLICLDRPSSHIEDRILPVICIDGEVFFQLLKRKTNE